MHWVKRKGQHLARELGKVLMSKFDNDEVRIRDEFKTPVPWLLGTETSYVNFTTAPKGSVKSKMHVCFLSCVEDSFPGKRYI